MEDSNTLSTKLASNPLVAYVLPDAGHPKLTGTAGQIRPALVVRDHSNKDLLGSDGLVNLHVFLDGSNDGGIEAINAANKLTMWVRNVPYDNTHDPHAEGEPDLWHGGTWHWLGDSSVEAKVAPKPAFEPVPVAAPEPVKSDARVDANAPGSAATAKTPQTSATSA